MASAMETLQEDARLGQVQSLVRAFDILDALGAHDLGMTLAEVTKATRLPRSTAHRLLTTMNALHYVEFDIATSRWMMGVQAFMLGAAFKQRRDLGRLGRPIMRALMHDAGETVNIGIPEVGGITYVGQARPVHAQCARQAPPGRLPMHTTASGKVILAHWDDETRDRFFTANTLQRKTALSIVEKCTLATQLKTIRARGYAIDDQENALGTRCVAAPVFDRNGQVRASLSISGSVTRLSEQRLLNLGQTLSSAARQITHEIGGLLAA